MASFSALALTAALFAGLAISFAGWGRAVRAALKIPPPPSDVLVTEIWIGWAAMLALFQFAHLFVPLRAWVVAPIFLLGVVAAFRGGGPIRTFAWRSTSTGALICIGAWLLA